MEKTLVLIVAATVLMITGVTLTFMTSGSLTDFDETREGMESSECRFQCEQADQGTADLESVSSECYNYCNEIDDSELLQQGVDLCVIAPDQC